MMGQKRVEKHVKTTAPKAGVANLLAVRNQAELASRAFAKHERARERGEDIGHKDHQKRLKAGLPIHAMSAATPVYTQQELVARHRERQLEQLASGRPSPLPAHGQPPD
jgi:hypothetical protein